MSDYVKRLVKCVRYGMLTRREALAKPDLTPEEKAHLRHALRSE